ncbi:hypothetical protein D3C84_439770 [compost metagenome]
MIAVVAVEGIERQGLDVGPQVVGRAMDGVARQVDEGEQHILGLAVVVAQQAHLCQPAGELHRLGGDVHRPAQLLLGQLLLAQREQGLRQPEMGLHHQGGVLQRRLQVAHRLVIERQTVAGLAQGQPGPAVLLAGQQLAHQAARLPGLTELELGVGLQAAAEVGEARCRIGLPGAGFDQRRQVIPGEGGEDALQGLAAGEGALQAKRELLLGEGFHQVFVGLGFKGAQHHGTGAVAADHDHHALGRDQLLIPQALQQLAAVLTRPQLVVEQIDVEALFLAATARLVGRIDVGDAADADVDQHRLHHHLEGSLLVDQQDAPGFGLCFLLWCGIRCLHLSCIEALRAGGRSVPPKSAGRQLNMGRAPVFTAERRAGPQKNMTRT